jgi:maleylacetate reductase
MRKDQLPSGVHSYPGTARIRYGQGFEEALAAELKDAPAHRVYVLASATLTRETDLIGRIEKVLGGRFVGMYASIGAHTPRKDVVAAANAARTSAADLVLAIGGGSITDAAKMVGLCLGNDVSAPEALDRFSVKVAADGSQTRPTYLPPAVDTVIIPTTLSAGEFSATAGCTDTVKQVKEAFIHPKAFPRTVILDPAVTVPTPEWLWLSTGIRAVDHAVEDLCSINSKPFSDGASLHALRLLGRGLPAVKSNAANLSARLDCQLGAWMSMIGTSAGVTKGASHGIGHVLGGTAGVPHGYTSCVMLPHVMRFNAPVNAERQALVSEALGRPGEPAADVLAQLIAGLGLPRTLRDVGVTADSLDVIAAHAMHDRWVHTNPRRIEGPAVVRRLLDAAW